MSQSRQQGWQSPESSAVESPSPEIKAKQYHPFSKRRESRRSHGDQSSAKGVFDSEVVPDVGAKEGDTHGFSKYLHESNSESNTKTSAIRWNSSETAERPPISLTSRQSSKRRSITRSPSPSFKCRWNSAEAGQSWPRSCKYFVPQVMDPEAGLSFISNDSKYLDTSLKTKQKIRWIDLGGLQPDMGEATFNDDDGVDLTEVFNMTSLLDHSTRAVFIPVTRVFLSQQSTYCRFGINQKVLVQILNDCMIPPTALELLHDKDGGHFSFTSHCSDNQANSNLDEPHDRPCAYHICLKLCTWLGEEHFLYGRHDFHTNRNFLLVAGSTEEKTINRLWSQFENQAQPQIISLALAILTTWVDTIRKVGWSLDCATQRLEAETGYTNLNFHAVRPLSLAKLSLRKELPAVRESLRAACRASDQMSRNFTFMEGEVPKFRELCSSMSQSTTGALLSRLDRQILQAFQQRKAQQIAQHVSLTALVRRLDTQWEIVSALRAAHSNHLTIEMARDSRMDLRLMRRIAFVTIIFLPATFMATFFSMAFFHVDEGRLNVSSWIWLYAVCTIPLTLFLGGLYGNIREKWRQLDARIKALGNESNEKDDGSP